jgi:hypothetical protein
MLGRKVLIPFVFLFMAEFSFSQTDTLLQPFYEKEILVEKGRFGSDSLILKVVEPFDTTNLMFDNEKRIAYIEYVKKTRFLLNQNGDIQDFHSFIYCPVGEWIPDLECFTPKKNLILVQMAYNYFGAEKNAPKVKNYTYRIVEYSHEHLILVRTN